MQAERMRKSRAPMQIARKHKFRFVWQTARNNKPRYPAQTVEESPVALKKCQGSQNHEFWCRQQDLENCWDRRRQCASVDCDTQTNSGVIETVVSSLSMRKSAIASLPFIACRQCGSRIRRTFAWYGRCDRRYKHSSFGFRRLCFSSRSEFLQWLSETLFCGEWKINRYFTDIWTFLVRISVFLLVLFFGVWKTDLQKGGFLCSWEKWFLHKFLYSELTSLFFGVEEGAKSCLFKN